MTAIVHPTEADMSPTEGKRMQSRAALLVVDMQNAYCSSKGRLRSAGVDTNSQEKIVSPVSKLVQACRGYFPIIWTRQVYLPERVAGTMPHNARRGVTPSPRGTWEAEIVDELKGVMGDDDEVIDKYRMSAFFETHLDSYLKTLGVRTIAVCGVSTNACVDSTIRDAYFRDYQCILVSDCVACSHPDLGAATLRNTELYFGQVMTASAAVEDFLDKYHD